MIFWYEAAKIWWPSDDPRYEVNYAWVRKYLRDCDHVAARARKHRTCIQAGGHVGLWPIRLAKSFDRVFTFEVQPSLQAALKANCKDFSNIIVNSEGLGDQIWLEAPLKSACSPGNWRIDPTGELKTTTVTIDSLTLEDVDAIVLDVEGYEPQVLLGAIETIQKQRPLLYVEELDRSRDKIHWFMKKMNYVQVFKCHRDVIYQSSIGSPG